MEKEIHELNCIIEEDCENIAALVNIRFEEGKDLIRTQVLSKIKKMLTPVPPHFDWHYDGCPYDFSGALDKNGHVSLKQTVSSFLENEYAGYSTATYTPPSMHRLLKKR